MELVQYVSNVGKQINESTKMNVDIDNTSVTNLVLLVHLQELYDKLEEDLQKADPDFPFTEKDAKKINRYINCLKKEINFYATMDIDENCILTEIEDHIIQE